MLLLISLFLLLLFAYIRLAEWFAIIDEPNQRSSHTKPTIRGGGVVFPIAWGFYSIYNGFVYPWFTAGLFLVAIVSFVDDIKPISARLRFLAHMIAFVLLFWELDLFNNLPWWGLIITLVVGIGIINAFNFMDGINGITGFYGLSIFGPLLIYTGIQDNNPFMFVVAAILAFGFFNFRKTARCFAGDVGSISLGFIVLFVLMQLIFGIETYGITTALEGEYNWSFLLFLSVYGVDSILTIIHRLLLKENIFKAHRKHLYQFLSNEMKWPHLIVALVYAVIQALIIFWVTQYSTGILFFILICLGLGLVYIVSKRIIASKLSKASEE